METNAKLVKLGNKNLGVLVACTDEKLKSFVKDWVENNFEDEDVVNAELFQSNVDVDVFVLAPELRGEELTASVSGDNGTLEFETENVKLF